MHPTSFGPHNKLLDFGYQNAATLSIDITYYTEIPSNAANKWRLKTGSIWVIGVAVPVEYI